MRLTPVLVKEGDGGFTKDMAQGEGQKSTNISNIQCEKKKTISRMKIFPVAFRIVKVSMLKKYQNFSRSI